MDEFKIKENKFLMFRNTKLKDNHPDYRGEVNIDGTIFEIVAWVKIDRKNDQFLSGSINPAKGQKIES